jgi:hypothetical protein
MTSKPESLVALAIGHSTRTIEEFVRLLQARRDSRDRRAYGAAFETQSSVQSRHFARLTEDHRDWLHARGGTWRSVLSATFLTHRMTSSPGTLFRPPGSRAILILASERNLQKFSPLCQAQYRKPTGGFFAAFTQSGSTASVSASMPSSCGRYQMTAAMLTNNTSLPISSCTKGTKRSQTHSMIFGVQRQSFRLQSFENSV